MPLTNYNRPDAAQSGWCDLGEAVRPTDPDIQIGWPNTQIPPARQKFNWLDKQQDAAIKYICRVGIAQWAAAEQYQGFGLVIGSNGSVYWNLRACQNVDPRFDNAGFWELTPIRLSDADARYITQAAAASLYLTRTEADGRYMLQVNMGAYVTWVGGDARYALKTDLSPFVTIPIGDGRYALRTELSNYETAAHAASTYLRMVDAANLYLQQSVAAQTYLTIADANLRFANEVTRSNQYADTAVNNMVASMRSWTNSMLPGMNFSREDYSNGSTMAGTWLILRAQPNTNNGGTWEVAFGTGSCQQGDTITVPGTNRSTPYPVGNMLFAGYVQSALGWPGPGDALLNVVFNMGSPGNYVQDCYFFKSNDAQTRRSRGQAYGRWVGFGYRTNF